MESCELVCNVLVSVGEIHSCKYRSHGSICVMKITYKYVRWPVPHSCAQPFLRSMAGLVGRANTSFIVVEPIGSLYPRVPKVFCAEDGECKESFDLAIY